MNLQQPTSEAVGLRSEQGAVFETLKCLFCRAPQTEGKWSVKSHTRKYEKTWQLMKGVTANRLLLVRTKGRIDGCSRGGADDKLFSVTVGIQPDQ